MPAEVGIFAPVTTQHRAGHVLCQKVLALTAKVDGLRGVLPRLPDGVAAAAVAAAARAIDRPLLELRRLLGGVAYDALVDGVAAAGVAAVGGRRCGVAGRAGVVDRAVASTRTHRPGAGAHAGGGSRDGDMHQATIWHHCWPSTGELCPSQVATWCIFLQTNCEFRCGCVSLCNHRAGSERAAGSGQPSLTSCRRC